MNQWIGGNRGTGTGAGKRLKMKAAVLSGAGSIRVETVDMPSPREDEALVRVHCIGVCGSDLHYYQHGRIGRYEVREPIVLGHELAGEVVAIGAAVRQVAVGDRVAVEPGVACGRCGFCKAGRYNLCPEVAFMATPPVNGAWSEYVAVRADFLFKLPGSVSYEQGALLEPLSVGIHAMRRTNAKPGDRVLVSGLGPIGLLVCHAAALFGVRDICATEVVRERRMLAEAQRLARAFDPTDAQFAANMAATGGDGYDIVVESSGNAGAISDSAAYVKRGGSIALIGLPVDDRIPLPVSDIIDRELSVCGVFRYANTYEPAIRALADQAPAIEAIITHRFALQDIQEAIDTAIHHKNSCVKAMIYPHAERM